MLYKSETYSYIVDKMQIIEFPMFNIKLNISKIAFNIFGIDIYWYALIIVFAIISALFYCRKIDGMYKIKFETILNICIWIIPIGVTIIFYCKKRKINLLNLLDYLAPAVALAQSIGRWGNFFNVEAYGIETNLPWRMCIIKDGIQKCVHPTFLYESICTFLIFILLCNLQKRRKFKGEILYLYLILYAFVRFWIEGIRIDSLMLYNFRISQILSIAVFILFLGIFTYAVIKNHIMSKKGKK